MIYTPATHREPFLTHITHRQRERMAAYRRAHDVGALRQQAIEIRKARPSSRLGHALSPTDRLNIIAEIKRASPSKGLINNEVDIVAQARSYAVGGAAAISVLTEERYFGGSLADLEAVSQVVDVPLLRKDFIVDAVQIYEAAVAGASAILLIAAALADAELRDLRQVAEEELGLDALVEVHTADEMRRAADCGATLIGVNNRNLQTLEVSLDTSLELIKQAPTDGLLISESGLREAADFRRLRAAGYHGFLVGETLMRAGDAAQTLRELQAEVI